MDQVREIVLGFFRNESITMDEIMTLTSKVKESGGISRENTHYDQYGLCNEKYIYINNVLVLIICHGNTFVNIMVVIKSARTEMNYAEGMKYRQKTYRFTAELTNDQIEKYYHDGVKYDYLLVPRN